MDYSKAKCCPNFLHIRDEVHKIETTQGKDSSARKPALVQDTNYMVEKTYHIAHYLDAFGAYVMPQWPIYGSKGVSIYQKYRWNVAVNSRYLPSDQKTISFCQKRPQKNIWLRKLSI